MQGIKSVLWGIHQYCGGIASALWEITAVHVRDNISTVGIPSVLWRLLSTVGVAAVYVKENVSTVDIPSVLWRLFSMMGVTAVYVKENISTVGIPSGSLGQ